MHDITKICMHIKRYTFIHNVHILGYTYLKKDSVRLLRLFLFGLIFFEKTRFMSEYKVLRFSYQENDEIQNCHHTQKHESINVQKILLEHVEVYGR